MNIRRRESGAANTWTIIGVTFIITTALALGGLTWALINYFDQKNNVDTKVSLAEATARKEQADADAAKFEEEEKLPNRTFVGPEDYGRLTFDYPKTWSVYISKDATNGRSFEAYLNPVEVPPVSNSQRYALRVTIETKDYEDAINDYDSLVARGDLKSSAVKANGENGTRLNGNFTKDIRGSAVLFKFLDKTVTIRTDADTFRKDFDALIKTIEFGQ